MLNIFILHKIEPKMQQSIFTAILSFSFEQQTHYVL